MAEPFRKPTFAFIAASWTALIAGGLAFMIGLSKADMTLSEKGFYLVLFLYGLFSAVSVQKSVRDRLEGIPVTSIYYGLSWFSVLLTLVLLAIGLWNATLSPSEKGFYAMSYLLSLFAAIAVQKNTRDSADPSALHAPPPPPYLQS